MVSSIDVLKLLLHCHRINYVKIVISRYKVVILDKYL